jgi:hypothetical protein
MAIAVTSPVLVDNLPTVLRREFGAACRDLARARTMLRIKDTPAHRAAVAGGREWIDRILDMYLQTRAATEAAG